MWYMRSPPLTNSITKNNLVNTSTNYYSVSMFTCLRSSSKFVNNPQRTHSTSQFYFMLYLLAVWKHEWSPTRKGWFDACSKTCFSVWTQSISCGKKFNTSVKSWHSKNYNTNTGNKVIINNGNWTEWSAIWSEIKRVISKWNQNCTTQSSIATLLHPFWNCTIL